MANLSEMQRKVFADVYKFYEESHDLPDTEEIWKVRARQLMKIVNDNHKTNLARNLAMAVYQTMSEDCRDKSKLFEEDKVEWI